MNSHRSGLIAIYGRRRIGKTHLVREFFSKNIIFSFTGLRNDTRLAQIENFMLELREVSNKFHPEKPQNWFVAFSILKQYLKGIKESKKRKSYLLMNSHGWTQCGLDSLMLLKTFGILTAQPETI